ncbi:hypothetical protein G8770_03475 [Aestuariicella hydrocarbonica]|uniref:Uncharacterized protein n=1 Tax=Pseudomaricurvus hydrocarbonicus TaxID=1470433 RepID=A0A9E5JU44_9GAMM|nr:hypothetical protein [Aestuariicella hydrocarbonica]NHO64605.1 hypothetical protein [Aestuariicella hydrocarbonica]
MERKITILGIFVGIVGIATTVYGYLIPNKTVSSAVVVSNSPAIATHPHSLSVTERPIPAPNPVRSFLTPSIKISGGTATLAISSVGANVTIKESTNGIPYAGGVISSTGVKQTVFVPVGQQLVVNLTGTGVDLEISRHVAEQITVNNTGTGSNVSIF